MPCKKWKSLLFYVWLPLSILLMELVVKLPLRVPFFSRGTAFTLLFSLAFGLLGGFLCCLWRGARARRRVLGILLLLCSLILGTQAVYYRIFGVFATLYSATGAGDVLQYWREALSGIWQAKWLLLPIFAPTALWAVLARRLDLAPAAGPRRKRLLLCLAAAFVLVQGAATLSVLCSTAGVQSASYLYSKAFIPNLSVSNFGVLTTLRLDIKYLVFGDSRLEALETIIAEQPESPPPEEDALLQPSPGEDLANIPVVYGNNVLEIDFDALLAGETDPTLQAMDAYFASRTPTQKNEYTGLFQGKNLIWLCCEAFDTVALDETHTPTLYKLAHEGFVFENFYTPIWGVSTSDGEYVTTTGLIPKSGVWSYARSAENYMPFALGRQFSALGYKTLAYHDHTYDYYDRDLSHPNMGYDYKGVGNGLELTRSWPESDLEMMQATLPEYIGEESFHIYYMTVSGHLNYNFYGNEMAMKHQADVADLPYSEEARAYIACNMELDQAIAWLIDQLDQAGILEDTVLCFSGDHYPYGLSSEAYNELAGYDASASPFTLYKSTLVLWCADMTEPVYVDKYCASLDVMPTLSNLFGLPYDSRLVMGHDILSSYPGLVEFSDHSWITEKGYYDAVTDLFTPFPGADVDEDYPAQVLELVNERFRRSAEILENDYYAVVFGGKDG